MALQTKINGSLVPGIVGEFSDGSPKTARAYLCYGTTGASAENPTFGRMFSFVEKSGIGTSDTMTCAQMGVTSTSKQMGILVNPKEHYIVGFKTGRTIAENGISATIATQGHIWVMVNEIINAGQAVKADASGKLWQTAATGREAVKGAQWLRSVAATYVGPYADYDASSGTYAVGDKVVYDGKHYVCKAAITVAEPFAPAKWEEVDNTDGSLTEFSATSTYAVGAKCKVTGTGGVAYYVCKAAISTAAAWDDTKWEKAYAFTEALAEVAIDNPGLEG